MNVRVLAERGPDGHGLFADPRGIRIVGDVHNKIEADGIRLFDLYVSRGPEFVAFDSEDVGELRLQDTVEIVVSGLTLYPSST